MQESSPGGASQTLYGKSPNCFLPTRYLFPTKGMGSEVFPQLRSLTIRELSAESVLWPVFQTPPLKPTVEYARDEPPDQQCDLNRNKN